MPGYGVPPAWNGELGWVDCAMVMPWRGSRISADRLSIGLLDQGGSEQEVDAMDDYGKHPGRTLR